MNRCHSYESAAQSEFAPRFATPARIWVPGRVPAVLPTLLPGVLQKNFPNISGRSIWPRCSIRSPFGDWFATAGRWQPPAKCSDLGFCFTQAPTASVGIDIVGGDPLPSNAGDLHRFAPKFAPPAGLWSLLSTHFHAPLSRLGGARRRGSALNHCTNHSRHRMFAPDGTLSIEEAAHACGVSDETIRRRLRANKLPEHGTSSRTLECLADSPYRSRGGRIGSDVGDHRRPGLRGCSAPRCACRS